MESPRRDEIEPRIEEAPAGSPPLTRPQVSYAALAIPLAVSILIVTAFFFFSGVNAALELLSLAAATATVAGKFIVLAGLKGQGLFDSPFKLAFLVVYLDGLVAFIAVYNIGILYKIPRFGPKLRALQKSSIRVLAMNPWMRKATLLGIVAFVMFPISGTGAIGGSVIGRLIGISRPRTLGAIAVGSVIGSFGMAYLADQLGDRIEVLKGNPVVTSVALLVFCGIAFFIWRRLKKSAAAARSAETADGEDDDSLPLDPGA